jgi:hypothetical protein
MSNATPFLLRALVAATVGVGLVSGWLRFIYETFVVGGAVLVPGWWIILHIASLSILFLLSLWLRSQDRKLCILSWCAFWLSLLPNAIPGLA